MAKRICKANVTAGIGFSCDTPARLSASYRSAKNAVSYRVLYGNMRAISAAEIDEDREQNTKKGTQDAERHRSDRAAFEEKRVHAIVRAVKLNEKEQLRTAADAFSNYLDEEHLTMTELRILLMKLVVSLSEVSENYGFSESEILQNSFSKNADEADESGEDLLSVLLTRESTGEVGDVIYTYCTNLRRMINAHRKDRTTSFVKKAEEYIRENYASTTLGIEEICIKLNVSAAYFSTAFKKETGKTFVNYLTQYRLEYAVRLLEETDDKTYVIAEKCGYSDPNYFSYVFKKRYGVSPSKYRIQAKGGVEA